MQELGWQEGLEACPFQIYLTTTRELLLIICRYVVHAAFGCSSWATRSHQATDFTVGCYGRGQKFKTNQPIWRFDFLRCGKLWPKGEL